ncbi:MAG TPA: NADPH-dependent assimilatory sulfite reductase hemoprotein subunit [Lacipirellulaceae bacterium]|nr:NADPH-dependent assimilatory sulfite reductase hemoprotein subunit [Lacipirellulaceae bacterium]
MSDAQTIEKPGSAANPAEKAEKLSPVEGVKLASNYLRGDIAQELVDGSDHFGKDSINLLKHHGTYQQDDRDDRKGGKTFSFMVRSAIPGGKLSSEQLLAELDLCDEVGNATLRITTRQGLQLHGVLKANLKHAIQRINEVQLSTLAACGDVERNVMCSPAPYKSDPVYDQLQAMTLKLAQHLRPQTPAYHELWLTDNETGEKQLAGGGMNGAAVVEPLYGPTSLPRKFKTAVGLAGDNIVDLYSQDLGFLGIAENWNVTGYNVLVGGGFGTTPSAEKTFPAVAQEMAYVTPSQVLDVAVAVIKVQRDFGNRADRKIARLKYLIHNWGLERFKQKVEEYYGAPLLPPKPVRVTELNDGMGWHAQGDGKYFYGLNVENGRIKDEGAFRLKTALREICRTIAPPLRLTPHQSILFCDLKESDKARLFDILKRNGVPLTEEISTVRRWAIACPALPTCGLAITESERIMPTMIDQLEVELAKLGLENEVFTTRMTGCPNGCARPYNSDIGLVGKTKDKYTIFLGGRRQGDRLNFVYQDLIPTSEVVPSIAPVLRYFKEAREPGESFGDFCHRKGKDDLLAHCSA